MFNARSLTDVKAGIWGFGADFDNMKIRCWYEHHFPLLMTEGLIPDLRKAVQTAARLLSLLRSALKEAGLPMRRVLAVISVLSTLISGT